MDQRRLELAFGMLEEPKAVPRHIILLCQTYRDACRLAWGYRRIKSMTYRLLAERGDFTYQHTGDWFNQDDKPTRRSMPASHISAFEAIVGNTIVSQWIASQSNLTVLEELKAERIPA